MQPNYKFYVYDKEISSNPEFSIERKGLVMFIDEDKHIKNIGKAKGWGEYQIAGEVLAAASTNYNTYNSSDTGSENQIIRCMRVIGTHFTFYKAIIPGEYLLSLGNGFPDKGFEIIRFPHNDKEEPRSSFDYMIGDDRKKIVDMLFRLKNELENS